MFLPPVRVVTRRSAAAFAILLLLGTIALCRPFQESPAAQRILQDIKYLASDELEGRGVGTQGIDRAADYIRQQFQTAGLKPVLPDGGYFQSFQTPDGSKLADPNRLIVQGEAGVTLTLRKDFMPLAISGEGAVDA